MAKTSRSQRRGSGFDPCQGTRYHMHAATKSSHAATKDPACCDEDPTCRASLVAQWLRLCLPLQGTRVRALVQEDPTCCGATKPVCHNY